MQCPYCHKEMESGHLRCLREPPVWIGDDDKVSSLDRTLGGIGQLTAAKRYWSRIQIPAAYCPACKKMIIDTGITK